ncbi:hypothetical protein V1478_000342 [Vespula squamosa]|uniref:Uncharacterized protein n=1 Tax=Vespula squamosa TaxID=30214 RepID=A0ABD2C581_VESSQ
MESKIVSTLTSRTSGKTEWYLDHSESPGLRWHGDVACGFGLERERYGRPSTLEKAAVGDGGKSSMHLRHFLFVEIAYIPRW